MINKHLKLQILILSKYQLNNIIIPTLEVLETHVGLFSVAAWMLKMLTHCIVF